MRASTPNSLALTARRVAVATAAAAALALGTAAVAHPRGGPGDGPVGPQVIESVKGKLNLDTAQTRLFDEALAEAKAARAAGLADRQGLRDTMRAELAKAEPDLAALARSADAVEARNRALRLQVRELWLRLYATLSPEQKAVIRDALAAAMERRDAVRGRMQERLRERQGG